MSKLIVFRVILLLVAAFTIIVYAKGLSGPFLFDDHIHITQNRWVKIDSLNWDNLVRAWDSSFSAFPTNRPLAQLSFGINHALSGLDPWAYKTTNLVIHLLNGVFVFLFARLAYRATVGQTNDPSMEKWFALTAAAFWLLTPLHVSTVLYTVRRMAQISTLALLLALCSYLWGRLQIAGGKPGIGWMLAGIPFAGLGFLGKENAILLPLMLLVAEVTLLTRVASVNRKNAIRAVWAVMIGIPLIAGIIYFLTHPEFLNYEGRSFTLEERALTQPRVLWLYLRLLLIPDISLMGLYHDGLMISTGLFTPTSTLFAILGWAVAVAIALATRTKAPFFAFAVLFFLAAHALESSVLPLEVAFEHRNYLASLGPILLLSYLITVAAKRQRVDKIARILAVLLLVGHGAATLVRVNNWSSYENFVLSTAKHHPNSPRSNFMAAQLLISTIANAKGDTTDIADAASAFLTQGLAADPRCINCLFGKIVLSLHLDQQPDTETLNRLSKTLRTGHVGATKISISQFSYLVKWQRSDGVKIPAEKLEALFDAALANPGWNHTGRGGIEAAYREYFEFVRGDLESALKHARGAINAWPDQWSYRMQAVQVLRKLGRKADALTELNQAARLAKNVSQHDKVRQTRERIERELQD